MGRTGVNSRCWEASRRRLFYGTNRCWEASQRRLFYGGAVRRDYSGTGAVGLTR